MNWRLRRAGPADAAALSLVASATFLETFAGMLPGADIVSHCAEKSGPAAFSAWLADTRSVVVVVAELDGTAAPVGYSVLTTPELPLPTDPEDVELKRIYTLASTHGCGLGAALMERALSDAASLGRRRMLLGVHPENRRARRFYERRGFRVIGERVFQVGEQRVLDPIYAGNL